MSTPSEPQGKLATRTIPMPADTNGAGDIFGGWVMSQMDLAGAVGAVEVTKSRVATVAVNAMRFHAPVHVGDVVTCYTNIVRIGNTSITVHIEVWVLRDMDVAAQIVTEADFTYVALDERGAPTPIQKPANAETDR